MNSKETFFNIGHSCKKVTKRECEKVPGQPKCEMVSKSVPKQICTNADESNCTKVKNTVCAETVVEKCEDVDEANAEAEV